MKRITAVFLALILLAGTIPSSVSAARESGYTRYCTSCKETGDLDGNNGVDPGDAMKLLACVLFPKRYSLLDHEHASDDCKECVAAGDLDQNGKLDVRDVLYLLYSSLFHDGGEYALNGCTCKDAFFVGYGRVDITPEGTMEIYNSTASEAAQNGEDILQMTCTAVDDGANTALLFSLDLRSFNVDFSKQMTDVIEKKFNIPADQVILNITHTHSTPSMNNSTAAGKAWRQKILTQLPIVVQAALDDLDEVAGVYTGTGYTDGITFVRRYLLQNGTYKTNPSASDKPVAHETEADNEMRTVRIDRKNKKDVLMVNYQTHYGSATSLYKGYYSADFVHTFRKEAEAKWDCHFVYHSGASANLNFMSAITGERKYSTYEIATREGFIPTVQGCMDTEEKVQLGKLRFASTWYEAPVYQDTAEDIANAKIVNSSGFATDSAEYKALCQQYGFDGYRQVQGIITRSSLGKTVELPFYAISFGDVAFASSPYEMFDTNGVQVREGSPFKMTFVCSYSNGGFGYVPSSIAFPHKSYEVYVSRFCETTGDDCAQEMVKLLRNCKNQG